MHPKEFREVFGTSVGGILGASLGASLAAKMGFPANSQALRELLGVVAGGSIGGLVGGTAAYYLNFRSENDKAPPVMGKFTEKYANQTADSTQEASSKSPSI